MAKTAAKFAEGDRVKIKERAVTPEDRKNNAYFGHMAGITGTIANMYENDEFAVKCDLDSITKATADVHERASVRMRDKFRDDVSEAQKKLLTEEELNFPVHYMLLVNASDLEKI